MGLIKIIESDDGTYVGYQYCQLVGSPHVFELGCVYGSLSLILDVNFYMWILFGHVLLYVIIWLIKNKVHRSVDKHLHFNFKILEHIVFTINIYYVEEAIITF